MAKLHRVPGISVLVAAWAIACAAGFGVVWVYANTPGDAGRPALGWHMPVGFEPHPDLPTLVVYAHPKCPCTRATFNELLRLQADCQGSFVTRAVFYEPADGDRSWRDGLLWNQARDMPECVPIADADGRLSAAAGARVSGTVALYSASGRVLFWGGITPSRAHEGENSGVASLRSILNGRLAANPSHDVYGCDLFAADECWAAGGPCGGEG